MAGRPKPTLFPAFIRSAGTIGLVGLLTHFAFAADLSNPKYRLQSRGNPDRLEGLEGIKISGGVKLDLVSVFLNAPGGESADSGNLYRLGFYLDKRETRAQIEVRDYNSFQGEYHYWMFPSRKMYEPGFHEFVWDATIAKELGLQAGDLGAVTRLGGYGYPVVVPGLLQAGSFPNTLRPQGVRFVFIANETVTVRYRLFPSGNKNRVFLTNIDEWHKDRKSSVS